MYNQDQTRASKFWERGKRKRDCSFGIEYFWGVEKEKRGI
jgi:hypothetical protein